MQIGRNIAFYRRRAGLTQTELSRRLGVTPQAVSKWERELCCPDILFLPALARNLKVTVDQLLSVRVVCRERS
ncbi:MAG: helix-turn-helix transcriptional regulator [Clostridia bacterium]|nr:helix-turn-helix transcriptional regulator [Clostridia bacterium]MBQ8381623.1 helix-turn-helix transcriptional regulator [Clostridia bacterium]